MSLVPIHFCQIQNSLLDVISSTVTSSVASGDWTTTSSLLSPNAPSGFNWLVLERTIFCCSCSYLLSLVPIHFCQIQNSLLDLISSTVTSTVASGDWTTTSSLLSPNVPSSFNWLIFERTISSCSCSSVVFGSHSFLSNPK